VSLVKLAGLPALGMLLAGIPAWAQIDFSGEWAPRFYEDQLERVPGPELGDYLGIPINGRGSPEGRQLGCLDSNLAGVAVQAALSRLHLARAVELAGVEGSGSGVARDHRVSR